MSDTNQNKIVDLLKEKYKGEELFFGFRNQQTTNIHKFMNLFLEEVNKDKKIIQQKDFFPLFVRFFFGGITLDTKIENLRKLNLSAESKKRLIAFLEDLKSKYPDKEDDKYCLGLAQTHSMAVQWYDGEDRKNVDSFIYLLLNKEGFEKIKEKLISLSEIGLNKFTPGAISNILIAYNPKEFYLFNGAVQEHFNALKISIDINDFKQYFDNFNTFYEIKKAFNLKDYGEVDSVITGYGIDGTEGPIKPPIRGVCKNLILYGPPGTGKTFNTKSRALEIIDHGE